jgi:hypothetical protein
MKPNIMDKSNISKYTIFVIKNTCLEILSSVSEM